MVRDLATTNGEKIMARTYYWTAVPPAETDNFDLIRLESLLSDAEKSRAHRFRFFEDYSAYITAHALLRTSLTQWDPKVAPRQWRFTQKPGGKPVLFAETFDPGIHFSLSHCRTLVACMLSMDGACGIDVERIGRVADCLHLADSIFSDTEVDDLRALDGTDRDEYFTALWCLKEAYLKAKGVGLTVPLDNFYFRCARGGRAPTVFSPPPGDNAEAWRFCIFDPCETHKLAAAVRLDPSTAK